MKRQKAVLATRWWTGTSSVSGNTTPIMEMFISQDAITSIVEGGMVRKIAGCL